MTKKNKTKMSTNAIIEGLCLCVCAIIYFFKHFFFFVPHFLIFVVVVITNDHDHHHSHFAGQSIVSIRKEKTRSKQNKNKCSIWAKYFIHPFYLWTCPICPATIFSCPFKKKLLTWNNIYVAWVIIIIIIIIYDHHIGQC